MYPVACFGSALFVALDPFPVLAQPRCMAGHPKELLVLILFLECALAQSLTTCGAGPYLRARDSYPLGRVRTPLARPDLFHFLELDGHVYNLKVVVLQRSLADAVRSVYRAGYHGGDIGLQVSSLCLTFLLLLLPVHSRRQWVRGRTWGHQGRGCQTPGELLRPSLPCPASPLLLPPVFPFELCEGTRVGELLGTSMRAPG